MHKAEITAEFITPCFCSGADENRAELRARSVRGMLRWWCRVCYPKTNKADLETELFGSTEGASPVKVRIEEIHRPRYSQLHGRNRDEYDPLLNYLWYFIRNRIRQRAFLPEGTRFKLVLSSRDPEKLLSVLKLCVVLVSVGSLGARSTRAAGAMKIIKIEYSDDILCEDDDFVESIKFIYSDLATPLNKLNLGKTNFNIWICQAEQPFIEGLHVANWFAQKWYKLRCYRVEDQINIGRADHDDIADWFAEKFEYGKKPNISNKAIRRSVLGMPYHQNIPKSWKDNRPRGRLRWQGKSPKSGIEVKRLSSPIHLRPLYYKGKIHPFLIIFHNTIIDSCPPKLYLDAKNNLGKLGINITVDKKNALENLWNSLACVALYGNDLSSLLTIL